MIGRFTGPAALVVVAACALLVFPPSLAVDVFELLPGDSELVDTLATYQRSFSGTRELIVALEGETPEEVESRARALAEEAVSRGLAASALWRDPLRHDPEALGELVARLWLDRPADRLEGLARRLGPGGREARLAETLDRLVASYRPDEVARLSRDPYGLTEILEGVLGDVEQGDPFASEDGTFRIVLLERPHANPGFAETRAWVERLRPLAGDAGLTGDAVFVAEIGGGLLRDVRRAALGTLAVVSALFLLAHRRLGPLVWLVGLLGLVLALTVAAGQGLTGNLHAVSLGFATILLGLAADYGLILYQERKERPDATAAELRKEVGPSIGWAAATTAGAFLMIARSSLPGLRQLGLLVAMGIAIAATVLVLFFLPPLSSPRRRRSERRPPPLRPRGGRGIWVVTAVVVAACLLTVARRPPGIDASTDSLGPRESEAQAVLDEVMTEITGERDPLWVLVEGSDEAELRGRIVDVERALDRAVERGEISGYVLPGGLLPDPAARRSNRERAGLLAGDKEAALAAAREAGFAPHALELTAGVFDAWERLARTPALWPTHPRLRFVLDPFFARDAQTIRALATLRAGPHTDTAALARIRSSIEEVPGARLFAWELLSETLLSTMRRDVSRVLVPLAVAILVVLGVAYRGAVEVFLSIAALALSALLLAAWMGIVGWSFHLMNVMALPLLFGAGVDYGIHVQLALKRHGGDIARMRRTVGRAILLCAASTGAGFGTLALADNAGLAGLGQVAAVGILISGGVSVFLLPAWWRSLRGRGTMDS